MSSLCFIYLHIGIHVKLLGQIIWQILQNDDECVDCIARSLPIVDLIVDNSERGCYAEKEVTLQHLPYGMYRFPDLNKHIKYIR